MERCLPSNCGCANLSLELEGRAPIFLPMNYILIPILVILCIFVVVSLVRGIIAFLKTTKIDLESGEGETVTEMQAMQNKAMFARIKYQAAAVAVVAVIALLAS